MCDANLEEQELHEIALEQKRQRQERTVVEYIQINYANLFKAVIQ